MMRIRVPKASVAYEEADCYVIEIPDAEVFILAILKALENPNKTVLARRDRDD